MTQQFSLLVKPVSGLCNIDCGYCFYRRALDLYPADRYTRRMNLTTAENMVRGFLGQRLPFSAICFQGGEPLLMGLDFYRSFVELEKRHGVNGQQVGNSFQTNGLLINDEWASFFKQYDMLIGISLDGGRDVHDQYRIDGAGSGTFDRVMAATNILRRGGVDFNILSMITPYSAARIDQTYRFFRDNRFDHLQFIPCVERDQVTGMPSEHTVSGIQHAAFYKRLFDLWYENGYPGVSIRLFDDILMWIVDKAAGSCSYHGSCDGYLLIEHNGDVYPCDFFAYDEWKLGNVNTGTLDEIARSPLRARFSAMKSDVPKSCRTCRHFGFCRADCTKFRLFTAGSAQNVSWLCPGFDSFLDYTRDRFMELAADVAKRRKEYQADQNTVLTDIPRTTPRNDPCPCGSGKKYKKCHGRLAFGTSQNTMQ